MTVKFGHDSLQDIAGTIVSSDNVATLFPIDNAVDWFPADYFKPDAAASAITMKFYNATAMTIDYIALAKHDLATLGARVKVEYSNTGFTGMTTALAATAIPDDGVFFKSFTQVSGKYIMLTFDRADAAAIQAMIGMVLIGAMFDTGKYAQIGFAPLLIDADAGNTNVSMEGNWLGKSIRKVAGDLPVDFKLIDEAWTRTYWQPLMTHLQKKPCVVSWDETNYPDDAALAWIEKASDMPMPKYGNSSYKEAHLKLKAVLA